MDSCTKIVVNVNALLKYRNNNENSHMENRQSNECQCLTVRFVYPAIEWQMFYLQARVCVWGLSVFCFGASVHAIAWIFPILYTLHAENCACATEKCIATKHVFEIVCYFIYLYMVCSCGRKHHFTVVAVHNHDMEHAQTVQHFKRMRTISQTFFDQVPRNGIMFYTLDVFHLFIHCGGRCLYIAHTVASLQRCVFNYLHIASVCSVFHRKAFFQQMPIEFI